MDEFEQRIWAVLEDAVPEPRAAVDLDVVRGLARSRRASMRQRVRQAAHRRQQRPGTEANPRRLLAIVGAVIVCAVIAVGAYVLAGGKQHNTGTAAVTTDPSELTSTSWQLIHIDDPRGTVPSTASAPVVFTFTDRVATDHVGDAASAHIEPGRISFGYWANDLMLHPGPRLDIAQTKFLAKLLSAETVRWSIAGDTLTIVKPDSGSLIFIRHPYDPSAPYGSISGRFMAVGGPAGTASPRPIRGIGTVQYTNTGTGQTQTGDTSTGGQYGISIAPGTYTITGYIATYQNGHVACTATKPVIVEKNHIATADLYCQQR